MDDFQNIFEKILHFFSKNFVLQDFFQKINIFSLSKNNIICAEATKDYVLGGC
jgi:hypothetical protein